MNFRQVYKKIFFRSIESDLSYEEAKEIIRTHKVTIIDVRNPEEYRKKHFQGAINIPLYEVDNISRVIKSKDEVILLYCKMGQRSEIAKQILTQKGYKNVYTFDAQI